MKNRRHKISLRLAIMFWESAAGLRKLDRFDHP